nr:paired immunoglobulin-like type 2 receptor beta transcript variant 4 [Sus scrofa]
MGLPLLLPLLLLLLLLPPASLQGGLRQRFQCDNILEMETLPWGFHLQNDPPTHP